MTVTEPDGTATEPIPLSILAEEALVVLQLKVTLSPDVILVELAVKELIIGESAPGGTPSQADSNEIIMKIKIKAKD